MALEHTLLFVKGIFAVCAVGFLFAILSTETAQKALCGINYENGYRPFSPNWITTYSVVVTFAGLLFYVTDSPAIGLALITFGAALDRIDGKIAQAMGDTLHHPHKWRRGYRGCIFPTITDSNGAPSKKNLGVVRSEWQMFWFEFNFPGITDLGKSFDPFADKLKILVVLVYFGLWAHLLNIWLLACVVVPEVFGTLMRRPFRFMKKWTHQEDSTGIGKYKALFQWLAVACCVPFHLRWIDKTHWASGLEWVPNMFLGLSIVLACLSVLSRFKFIRQRKDVNRIIATVEESTKHE